MFKSKLNGITIDYSVDPSSTTKRFRYDADVLNGDTYVNRRQNNTA